MKGFAVIQYRAYHPYVYFSSDIKMFYRKGKRTCALLTVISAGITVAVYFSFDILFEDRSYMKFITKADRGALSNPFIHRHRYNFLLNNNSICDNNIFLVICVHSHPQHAMLRKLIRSTWGSVREHNGAQIRIVFFVGLRILKSLKETERVNRSIKAEGAKFNDIVQGNFIDSYRNLTYKSVMNLHWINLFCNKTHYVVKTDDDVIINIFKLIKFLQNLSSQPNHLSDFMYGKVNRRISASRNNDSKWYLSDDQYRYRLFPPYCNGIGYIFSNGVAAKLYKATTLVPFIPIEDVYIGFCSKVSGVTLRDSLAGFDVDFRFKTNEENFIKALDWSVFINAGNNETRWRNSWHHILSSSFEQHSIFYYRALSFYPFILCSLLFILILILRHRRLYNCFKHKFSLER